MSYNEENRRVRFSFVDFGVGIFENLEGKTANSSFHNWRVKMKKLFSFETNSQLLEHILDGTLHKTVTGKPYRGKGLPGIANASRGNHFDNLYIISNDVFCNYDNIESVSYTHLTLPTICSV